MRLGGSRLRRATRSRREITVVCAAVLLALALTMAGSRATSAPVAFAHPQPLVANAATELLADGGFEQSPSGWQQYSRGGYSIIASAIAHSGSFHFYACGYPGCDDRVWQAITLPGTIHSATLRFWVASTLSPYNLSGGCRDNLKVLLEGQDTSNISTLWSACRATLGYTLIQIDVTGALSPNAGKQVILAFRGTTANLASSSRAYSFWFVDDVSLSVS